MNRAVTIGTFDGVHRGHQLVLSVLKEEATKRGLQPIAMTFDRHPLDLICPDRAPGNLLSTRRKEQLLRKEQVTPIILTFNEQLRGMRAYDWLDLIHRKYDVRMLVAGYDNTFGCDGLELSLHDIQTMGEAIGIEVIEAPEVPGVSSSKVRKAVKAGDISQAIGLLGHEPELEGKVISGFHVGGEIGFPTANLQPSPGLVVPARGVYAARAFIEDEPAWYPSMVNIGIRPTFEGSGVQSLHPTVEAHVIGLDKDLYGKQMRLEWLARLRDEQKFDSVDALKRQLEKDKEKTMDLSHGA